MTFLRQFIFIGLMILLEWLFVLNTYQMDMVPVKNEAFQREQIMEIENSNSISQLKTIAKSKVDTIGKIHQLNDEKSTKELYILSVVILMSLFLYFTKKPIKTHNP